jgi:hypothetical protein
MNGVGGLGKCDIKKHSHFRINSASTSKLGGKKLCKTKLLVQKDG